VTDGPGVPVVFLVQYTGVPNSLAQRQSIRSQESKPPVTESVRPFKPALNPSFSGGMVECTIFTAGDQLAMAAS
jgi:hypothetical protein